METYVWQSAVAADGNLRLVGIDKDLGVALGTAAAIALDNALVRPADRLLVNHFHCGKRLWLVRSVSVGVKCRCS